MRNKKISSIAAVFAIAIALFSAANFARAETNSIIISEVLLNGQDGKEFIELYNSTDTTVDMSGWILNYYSKDRDWISPYRKKFFPANSVLGPNEFFLISIKTGDYSEEGAWNLGYSSYQLNNADGAIGVFSNENFSKQNAIDVLSWGDAKVNLFEGLSAPVNKSLEKIDFLGDNTRENWQESCKEDGTPGEDPKTCGAELDSSPEDDGTSDPAEEASLDSDDKTDASEKVYSKNLKITELFPNPSSDEDAGEFTEIYNADSKEIIELSGWKLEDKTGNSYPLPDVSLQPGKYRAFYRNSSKFSLNNTGSEEIFLKNPIGEVVDHISYSGTVKEDSAYALSDSDFLWTSSPTPGEKNIFDAPSIEASIEASMEDSSGSDGGAATDGNVYLSEILPNPKDGSDGEYIEIANGNIEPVDLFGWRIKDTSKSKGYQFKEHTIIDPGEYLAVYRPDSKIALNNSDESVYLYNPKNEIASSVSFAKSIKNSSYNFDREVWKWSKYLTPSKKNKFDSQPSVKITKPKHAYKDLFTEFSANAKDKETKKLKYSWDFGDGKKSALAKTSHKYLDTGKYTVTLSVTDDSQAVEKNFTLEVKKYPRPNLEIVKIIPNPAGSDTETETIDLKNNSNKKINLTGWKIATGSGEKIYNHPISEEFSLDANETKTITREFSKFSLNNKAGKIQLIMPDGKVADVVEYAKEKITEDEAYAKIDGEWQWLEPGEKDENTDESDTTEDDTAVDDQYKDKNGEVLGVSDENQLASSSYNSSFNSESAYIFLSRINFVPLSKQETKYCSANSPSSNIAYLIASLI
ncbi:MAG: lamin tail domain-containing protein [Parcubacteria group bacterium]|jgi:hypothetical protein